MEKLARFCTTFAMRVSVRDVCSSGYSWVRLKSDGDMMAGHRKRRKREPLMRRSAMSSRPLSAQRTLQEANTSLSSRGKTLQRGYTAGSDTNWRRLSDSLQLPGEESEVSSIFKVAERDKHTVCCLFFFLHLVTTYQRELTILQSASSQHIRRLAWWSGSTEGGVLMGSTSQFSSDSYKALMNSPANDISLVTESQQDGRNNHQDQFSLVI